METAIAKDKMFAGDGLRPWHDVISHRGISHLGLKYIGCLLSYSGKLIVSEQLKRTNSRSSEGSLARRNRANLVI